MLSGSDPLIGGEVETEAGCQVHLPKLAVAWVFSLVFCFRLLPAEVC